MEPESQNKNCMDTEQLNLDISQTNTQHTDNTMDSSFDASIDLPLRDFETQNEHRLDEIPSETQIESIISAMPRNIDKENIDPVTKTLSPRSKPGSVRRSVLKDLTDKYLRRDRPTEEIKEEDSQDEEIFSKLTDSPLRNRNFREL